MSSRKLRRVAGLPGDMVDRLNRNKVHTCKDLLSRNIFELLKWTGTSYQQVVDIQKAVSRIVAPRVHTALEMRSRSLSIPAFFATSLPALDRQLHGGLPCGTITEITGPAGCGKTQFCIMLSILATLPQDQGGLGANVIYIDTEAAFSATRMVEMAENRFPGLFENQNSVLSLTEKIHVFWEPTCKALWERLQSLEEEVISRKVKLIVLDSVASLIRKEFDSQSSRNIKERTNLLSKEAAILKYIAETFNIPVVVTNQITSRFAPSKHVTEADIPDVDGVEVEADEEGSDHVIAALGNTWSHAVNTRLILQFLDETYRQVMIAKSPIAPFDVFTYSIQIEGLRLHHTEPHTAKDTRRSCGNPSLQTIKARSTLSIN
ncbi:DNA repair protein RAD51 homolog 2 isoform X2 [Nematostella vectensis]|uniref:DNA repair protein RAD51 homolog 2 isoform X2 n=1 Tax=Nematostella vectensis TaxID=45351 RepID=UPI0020777AF6|nr:DNA repair protein RAD51 homolog 2 isoform X2 [Nematostella vectensis]